MGRAIAAVGVGALFWAVFWNLGTLIARMVFPGIIDPELPISHTGALVAFVLYSAMLSILAGYITAAVRGATPMVSVWVLACIQLVLGFAFEAAFWHMTPLWYHLVFLAFIVPATVWGGLVRVKRTGTLDAA
jgi:hypothetical protein